MKRKFKILIIAISSVIAMLFAFSIVSNAAVPEIFDDDLNNNSSWLTDGDYTEYSNRLITLIDGDDHQLAYFYVYSDFAKSVYSNYGTLDLSFENFQAVFDPLDYFFSDMLVNYVNFFNYLNNNTYDSLGEIGELSEFQYARDVYLSLKNSYTQTDLDNAVTEATKDMYTQTQLDEAVAKALANAESVSTNSATIYDYFFAKKELAYGEQSLSVQYIISELVEGKVFTFLQSYTNYGFQPVAFREYVKELTGKETPVYSDLVSVVQGNYTDSFAVCWQRPEDGFDETFFNKLFGYIEITEDDLVVRYNEGYAQGEADGVTEYKSSEEYTNTINLAKSAGVDEYKNSDEYASALNSKYNEGHIFGTAAGITAYKSSTEYKKALSAEYDEGYDTGFEDGENSIDFAPIIVGIVVLATIAIALLIVNKKRKKSYRR